MAREHARVKLSIWEDDEFRDLSVAAQHLYQVLMIHPKLDYCGVTEWRPGKISGFARDWTSEDVEMAGKELSEKRYIVIDERTEEVLIRSFIRSDGLLDSPNLATAVRKAHMAIASSTLRGVVVYELNRLRADQPDLKGWDKIEELLPKASVNPSEIPSFNPSPNPSVNPSRKGSGNPSASPSGKGEPNPSGNPSVNPSLTTAPATATSPKDSLERAQKRRAQISDEWKPTEADVEWQRAEGITDPVARRELPKFIDHWRSKGEPRADWSATWRNWLRRAEEFTPSTQRGQSATSHVPVWDK